MTGLRKRRPALRMEHWLLVAGLQMRRVEGPAKEPKLEFAVAEM